MVGLSKSWSRSMDVYSWCSMLASGVTRSFNFFIWAIFHSLVSSANAATRAGGTKHDFWIVLKWSLEIMQTGLWPLLDWRGQPLRGTDDRRRAGSPLAGSATSYFVCVLVGIRSDLDFDVKELHLPDFRRSLCAFCPATPIHGPNCINEFRENVATWMGACYNIADWPLRDTTTVALFKIPGVSILTKMPDFMHSKHLGTDMYFYASVLWMLCYQLLGNSALTNLETVWTELQRFAKRNGIKTYSNMRQSMFTNPLAPHGQFPRLKGRAAEIRALGKPLAHVWEMYRNPTDMQHTQVSLALRKNIAMEDILEDNKSNIVLPRLEYERFRRAGFDFLVLFNALGGHFAELGRKLFNVTIKAHYVGHGILRARHINPRWGWCYSGEDFMGITKRLMAACCKGNTPAQAARKFAKHYRIGLHNELAAVR